MNIDLVKEELSNYEHIQDCFFDFKQDCLVETKLLGNYGVDKGGELKREVLHILQEIVSVLVKSKTFNKKFSDGREFEKRYNDMYLYIDEKLCKIDEEKENTIIKILEKLPTISNKVDNEDAELCHETDITSDRIKGILAE
ncbi:MAG: hypothetical protein Q9M94_07000 [Candidatus Gracilibacteria bacterium]|nr:hypothetical protein [Candidatus Gracilibacteria bacterium]MDQ7022383.1 hypothetical protein [Candidatus Gracilibacteria bacterium]